ncbi:MAG: hypothetical protein AB9873_06460 [Syntrophobacteraceae bacterium]
MTSGKLAARLDSLKLQARHEVYVSGEVAPLGVGRSFCSRPGIIRVLAEEVEIR